LRNVTEYIILETQVYIIVYCMLRGTGGII